MNNIAKAIEDERTEAERVFDIIEDIARSRGNDKIAILRGHRNKVLLEEVLKLALDPLITFGMDQVPERRANLTVTIPIRRRQFPEAISTLRAMQERHLTGNAAQTAIQNLVDGLNSSEAELLKRIIKKDLRAGIAIKSVNKAIPGLISEFACATAKPFEPKRVKSWPCAAETKLDGVRTLIVADMATPEVQFLSRSGREFTSFDHLKTPVLTMLGTFLNTDNCPEPGYTHVVLDSEVISGTFNETSSHVRRKETPALDARVYLFDILHAHEFLIQAKTGAYGQRRRLLEQVVACTDHPALKLMPRFLVHSIEEIDRLYEKVLDKGLEGLIIKPLYGRYEFRRSYSMMKMKAEESIDLKITGSFEGTGKYEGMLGGLFVDFNGVEVRVGGGFSDAQRIEFWQDRESLQGRLIEVCYHCVTEDGSLRHPRFKQFRDNPNHPGIKQ